MSYQPSLPGFNAEFDRLARRVAREFPELSQAEVEEAVEAAMGPRKKVVPPPGCVYRDRIPPTPTPSGGTPCRR